jgi:hypothetical protein
MTGAMRRVDNADFVRYNKRSNSLKKECKMTVAALHGDAMATLWFLEDVENEKNSGFFCGFSVFWIFRAFCAECGRDGRA